MVSSGSSSSEKASREEVKEVGLSDLFENVSS